MQLREGEMTDAELDALIARIEKHSKDLIEEGRVLKEHAEALRRERGISMTDAAVLNLVATSTCVLPADRILFWRARCSGLRPAAQKRAQR